MANIHETIAEVKKLNPELAQQVQRYVKEHSYGLVFEQNLPDAVRLWTKKPAKGDKVNILPPRGAFDTEENNKVWYVIEIVDGMATLSDGQEVQMVSAEDIVPIVGHKDEIYPGLKVIDKVERGEANDPYHMVINAENYHALEALCYAYAGKVDCIYIDPPYNTGAKDWKYNNDYVGQDDQYRHSKWLAMMERRLKLAKKLLNPADSVMIVTIDEKEYLRLGMLLEQTFPEANMQMISTIINVKGVARDNEFSRANEYVFVLRFGNSSVQKLPLNDEWLGNVKNSGRSKLRLASLLRSGSGSKREDSPGCFYPIFVTKNGKYVKTGEALELGVDRYSVEVPEGLVAIFPIHKDGSEGRWMYAKDNFKKLLDNGFVYFGKLNGNRMGISYAPRGVQNKIKEGLVKISGVNEDGSVNIDDSEYEGNFIPNNQWSIASHNATEYGTKLNQNLLLNRSFPYPKSLYAVEDVLRFFVVDKPNALIVDFFAGSGTTAHATMLLNHLDGGHRRTIMVTNNEIGPDAEKDFTENKYLRPSDEEWQKYGIAKYITWERVKAAITGINTQGEPIKGDYKFTEEFPMSEGFKENAIFCELTYEDPWAIRLDHAFNAVAPILWMLAGCKGKIIEKLGKGYATTCHYAVLFKYDSINKLVEILKNKPSIEHVFVVTDDQQRYLNIIKKLNMIKPQNIHRLYESYLRSFEIVGEGGLD